MLIEFYARTPLEFDHFGPVCSYLNSSGHDCRFVVPYPKREPGLADHNYNKRCKVYEEELIHPLSQKGLPYADKITPEADIALTTQDFFFLNDYQNKKIKFRYGIGTIPGMGHYNQKRCLGFDAVMVHGVYEFDIFSKFFPKDRIRIMGYPRYDHYFCATNQRPKPNSPLKKILYLSTIDKYANLKPFQEALLQINQSYELLIKLHPGSAIASKSSYRHPNAQLDKNKYKKNTILPIDTKLEDVIGHADLVIVDAKSGSFMESVFLKPNIPIIALCSDCDVKKYNPDILKLSTLVSQPSLLYKTVKNLLNSEKTDNTDTIPYYIQSTYGNDSSVAAKHLLALAKKKKISGSLFDKLKIRKHYGTWNPSYHELY